MLCAARKAAPIYADWSGFILFMHKHGDSKGIQSLWQGFGDSVPITNPSETRYKDVSAARMLFRMGKAALLKKGAFPKPLSSQNRRPGVFRTLRSAA